jgi:hypothetical protein
MEEREQHEQTEDVEAHVRAKGRTEEPENDPGVRARTEDDDEVEAHMRIRANPPAPEKRSI